MSATSPAPSAARTAVSLAAAFALLQPAWREAGAQRSEASQASAAVAVIRAVAAGSPIRVDGRLDEATWQEAPAYSAFVQRDPDDGEPATELTEVRVLYGADALYIGGRMYDTDPRRIRARLARRDEPIFNADVLEVYIDSRNDGLSAYVFRITPAGALRDATMDANLSQDNSWDAVWEGVATMDSLGWTAELRIPFSQLRYSTGPADTVWGIQFSRVIGWRGETSFLPPRPKALAQSPGDWARLVGLSELPRGRHVEIVPYSATRATYLERDGDNPFRSGADYRLSTGLDLRYGLTNNLTVSGTINPDFGQVEVDPARINLTQNELFFPERRPFFVERADVFRFGQVRFGTGSGFPPTFFLSNITSLSSLLNPASFEAFHSRRIGRTPQLQPSGPFDYVEMPDEVTIGGAVKLTGRTPGGLSVGILNALTMREEAGVATAGGDRSVELVEPRTNYFAGRVRQELRDGNTVVGVLGTAVNRRLEEPAAAGALRRDAYFTGLDLQHSWRQREWSFDAAWGVSLVAGTEDAIAATQRSPVRYFQRPDRTSFRFDPTLRNLGGSTLHGGVAKNAGRHWLGNLFYRQVSPGLEVNDIGFGTVAGFRTVSWSVAYKEDVPGRRLRAYQIRPYGFVTRNWENFHGRTVTGLSTDMTFLNFWQLLIRPEHTEGGFDSFHSRGGPLMRRADVNRVEVALTSDRRRTWSADFGFAHERDDIGSWHDSYMIAFDWRPIERLRLNLTPGYVDRLIAAQYVTQFADPDAVETFGRRYVFGSLRYHELSLTNRIDWTFSPTMSLQFYGQPLIARGVHRELKALRRPRTLEFDTLSETDGTLGRDGDEIILLPSGPAFRIGDPDFKTRTLLGNAVFRWEYRPGSALFVVWQQRRAGAGDEADFVPGRDLRRVFSDRPENVIAVKATYWLEL